MRNANLWIADRDGEAWGEPRYLGGAGEPERYDSGPWFDERGVLHFASTSRDWSSSESRLSRPTPSGFASWERDPEAEAWADWRADVHVWHTVPSPDGRLLLLDVSDLDAEGRRGPTDQWAALSTADGWGEPVRLPPPVNTPTEYENFAVFAPDGRTVYFARGFSTYHEVDVEDLVGWVEYATDNRSIVTVRSAPGPLRN